MHLFKITGTLMVHILYRFAVTHAHMLCDSIAIED